MYKLIFILSAFQAALKTTPSDLGWKYVFILLLILILLLLMIKFYRMMNKKHRHYFMLILVFFMPLSEMLRVLLEIRAQQYSIDDDLPLQVCRIMLFLNPIAIITRNSKLKGFCYVFGLPGAVAAFLFPPTNSYAIASSEHIRYLFSHFTLVLVPLLWVAADGFSPNIRLLKRYAKIVLASSFILYGVNTVLGSNYMYINHIPEQININIGQPWYFILFVLVMLLTMTLMFLPFKVIEKKEKMLLHH